MIVRAALSVAFLLALASAPLVGQDKKPEAKEPAKADTFERFKQLAGEWVGKEQGGDGHEAVVKYKVTSGGSAVVETIFPGTEHEMLTVFTRDGDDVQLTHYCMLGNQPQMKAAKADGDKVQFKFVRAANMKSDKDMHMHDATYTFVDKDTFRTEWTLYNDGKATGQKVFEFKRKK
jgi:hypothetical protein